MELTYIHPVTGISIAELTDEKFIMSQPKEVLDIFGDLIAYFAKGSLSTKEAFMLIFSI